MAVTFITLGPTGTCHERAVQRYAEFQGIEDYGIELIVDFFVGLEMLRETPDAFLVGCVGHLARHKGHGTLLDATAQLAETLPHLRLLMIGEGSERTRLEARAAEGPLAGRVTFVGFRDDVPRLVAALDLLVLPSISGEGSPAVIKEAMACGVPVVATDLEGVREIVEDGRDALLVPVGDPDRLAAAIRRAASDAGLRRNLTAAGRVRVKEFSSDRMVERTLEVYRHVLDKGEAGK